MGGVLIQLKVYSLPEIHLSLIVMKLKNNNSCFPYCFMFMLLAFFLPVQLAVAGDQKSELRETALSMFKPLDRDARVESSSKADMIFLGRMLFFDQRISASGAAGCKQCHQPEFYGSGSPSVLIDADGKPQSRNVQTVLNASLSLSNNWYGDVASIENQALAALVSSSGLAHANNDAAMEKIKAIPEYGKMFSAAFPKSSDPVTPENWAAAIGAFERTLLTPSPFDAYLAGDNKAISADAKTGLRRFIDVGCVACHNGIGIGGNSYQKFGIWEEYWLATNSSQIDKGRFNLTKDDNDLYVFRVANLRNVKMTAPYFHDGSVKELPDAVRIMGKIQLRKTLSDDDVKYIVAFLATLTGKIPENFSQP